MAKNDGGPVFPSSESVDADGMIHAKGLSLRDYFAGQALAGCLAYPGNVFGGSYQTNATPGFIAAACYGFADAMLAMREKGKDDA